MDKLINVKIENSQLTFTVDTQIDLNNYSMKVYIDEVSNIKNILLDNTEHNICIDDFITIDDNNNVTVINQDVLLPLDRNMKYITLYCYSYQTGDEFQFNGIYYTPEIIYDAEIRKLNSHCSTCLDDQMMQTLMLVVFKRQLLEYAINTDHFKDALQLYIDLCRLLDVSVKSNCNCVCNNGILTQTGNCINTECSECLHLEKDRSSSCTTCINGCCTL